MSFVVVRFGVAERGNGCKPRNYYGFEIRDLRLSAHENPRSRLLNFTVSPAFIPERVWPSPRSVEDEEMRAEANSHVDFFSTMWSHEGIVAQQYSSTMNHISRLTVALYQSCHLNLFGLSLFLNPAHSPHLWDNNIHQSKIQVWVSER